jgi:hypothetical protein
MLVQFTYRVESDGHLVIRFAKKVDYLIEFYPEMQLCALPSVDHLIEESV